MLYNNGSFKGDSTALVNSPYIQPFEFPSGGPVPPVDCFLVTLQGTFIVTLQGTNMVVNCSETNERVIDNFGNYVITGNGDYVIAAVE